ncbi:MAG TPA: HEAT repeat domain-containing protein [Nostocaceae cyanobacterium]|nr:HEAT repeat domain-containing protein [Nostocaceae cyanobacterium]
MSPDFQPYLKSICDDKKYKRWERQYTPSDALTCDKPDFWLSGLMVQTVPPPQRQGEAPDREQIERFNVLEGLRKYAANHHVHVLLVGRPGSGKSTALQRLLWEEAQKPIEELDKIPVLIELRQYETNTLELIQNSLEYHYLYLEITEIKKLLGENRFLLLFDGVNELPKAEARQELNKFRQKYRRNPMIFTTRDIALGGSLEIEKKLEIQPLTETQMQQFVRAYLPDKSEEMLQRLGEKLQTFAQTPLFLLEILCTVFKKTGDIPTNLGLAFHDFTQIYDEKFLYSVQVNEDFRLWLPKLLQHLAFTMMQGEEPTQPRFTIKKQEADEILTKFLEGKIDCAANKAKIWLEELLKHHLIQYTNNKQIEFRHQLLQEYYAAEYLLPQIKNLSDAKLKRDYLNYLKWTEPLALMLALLDNEAQAVRVVKLSLEVDLMLGARLAGEVKTEYQEKTVKLVFNQELPLILKINLLGVTLSRSAISILVSLLNHNLFYKDENCVIALAKIDSNIVINDLIKIVQTKKSWIIYGEYTDSDIYNLEIEKEEHEYIRRSAIKELGKVGNHLAIDTLIKVLSEKDFSINIVAVEALLENIDKEAVFNALLQQSLEDQSFYIRNILAKALYNISGKKILSRIVPILESKDASVRARCVEVLGNLGTKTVSDTVFQLLSDEDCFVRLNAAKALGKIGDESGIIYLIKALEYEESAIIYQACDALGELRNKTAIPTLIKLLSHQENSVSMYAAKALGKIGDSIAIPALLGACTSSNFLQELPDILGEIGTEVAVPRLLKVLDNKSLITPEISYIRHIIIEALGKVGSKVATPKLIEALSDKDDYVRIKAAEALGNIGNKEAIPHLLKVLSDDKSDYVRWSVALALSKLGNDAGIDILIESLKNNFNEEERWISAEALEKVGSIALPSLFKCLLSVYENYILSEVLYVISSIQKNCNYYNYTIANYNSLALEEENKRDPLLDTLNKLNKTMSENQPTAKYSFPKAETVQIVETNNGEVIAHKYAAEKKQNEDNVNEEITQISDISTLIAQGEGSILEFKSSAWWDFQKNKREKFNKRILETIAAFLNIKSGGILLIGVDDNTSIVGIECDYNPKLDKQKNRDIYENNLMSALLSACGLDCGTCFQITFHEVEAKDICKIIVEPSPRPIYISEGQEVHFFIRAGNSNRSLDVKAANEYIKQRWK